MCYQHFRRTLHPDLIVSQNLTPLKAEYAASKLPKLAASALHDALNLNLLCNTSVLSSTAEEALAPLRAQLTRETARHFASREATRTSLSRSGAIKTFFVATPGDDAAGDGSLEKPFATLPRAAIAARLVPNRSPGDVTVFVRAGTYYMGITGPLLLTEADRYYIMYFQI